MADRQHGLVTYRQLAGLGVGRGGVRARVVAGRLHRVYRAVYSVGHRQLGADGRRLAAVLACGPGALLSHRSAAAHLGLSDRDPRTVDVTAPRRTRAGPRGIALHLPRRLHAEDSTIHDGIPITSVARTLLDIAQTGEQREVDRALDTADRLHLLDLGAAERLLERSRGHRGQGRLARALGGHVPGPTRSELEQRFLKLCRETGLPDPRVNTRVAGIEVDAAWPDQHLVVELDGHAYHRTPRAFEADRRRDATLQLHGYRVVRVTYRRLHDEPAEIARIVRELLS